MSLTRDQLLEIEAALTFYANPRTWQRRGRHQKGEKVQYAPAPFTNDHGARARHALHLIRASKRTGVRQFLARLVSRQPTDLGAFRPTVPASLTDASEA